MKGNKPRVALVHDWLTNMAGGEQVLMALHRQFPEAPIYTSLHNPEKTKPFADATVIPSYLQRFSYLRTHHQIAIPLMPLAFESFNLKGYDAVISIGCGLSKGVITQPDQFHVSYCNTPTRYLWKIGDDTRADGLVRSRVSHSLRLWDVVSADRVDQFLANSNTVKERIAKVYRKDSRTVYPPVEVDRFRVLEKPEGDYLLSVGRLIPYKRVDLIIQACVETKQPLKVAGTGPEEGRLRALAKDAPWIEFLGRVPDVELERLYQHAKAFVFAAEEDFGIVPVEAMASGRPVIAYGKGGATETVVEGLSGTLFGEQSVASLAQSIAAFDGGSYEPSKIRRHAESFSAERFGREIADVLATHFA